MRVGRERGFWVLLGSLFLLGILRREGIPGEEILPEFYRVAIHEPLLAAADDEPNAEEERVRLLDELDRLRRENRQLKEKLTNVKALDELLADGAADRRFVAVPARVYSREPGTFGRAFRIGRGRRDGLQKGMPVVDGISLVGVVSDVNARESTVLRVDDPRVRVEVEVEVAGEPVRGVAFGSRDGLLQVRFLRAAHSVQVGAPVFTTAWLREIPANLLVGRVREVEDQDGDQVLEVVVEPASDLEGTDLLEVLMTKTKRERARRKGKR